MKGWGRYCPWKYARHDKKTTRRFFAFFVESVVNIFVQAPMAAGKKGKATSTSDTSFSPLCN